MTGFEVDLTDIDESGNVEVPPAQYLVEAEGWKYYISSPNENPVILMRGRILEGDYRGESVVGVSTITGHKFTRVKFKEHLEAFGLVSEEDRDADTRKLRTSLSLSKVPDDSGKFDVEGVIINGTIKRPIGGRAIAIVTPRSDGKGTSVEKFVPPTSTASAPESRTAIADTIF